MAVDGVSEVAGRVAELRARIEAAARRSGHDPRRVTLVAASKTQPPSMVRAAFDAGVTVFGESRVQEALAKMPSLPSAIEWHFIGPLQTNKVRAAVAAFSAFHSVDRVRLAEALQREAQRLGRAITCFLEVNVANEATKHGFSEEELVASLPALAALDRLRVVGLMCVPPAGGPEASRPWFGALRRLAERVGRCGLERFEGMLSMGMSEDFEVAIEEGATHVRIGSALFGRRGAVGGVAG